ncbi:hypothetical protein N7539_006183 [Penicillium diatomitis]|uniref:Uncharacterized protein n=1 Tax=Penicillium diatomitis TaxID=2819901 RepID=A0A9X0BSP5_9EURO|nr:uncharacterized protein N7539_006183 [Penicillium diatomitis]KAJ5482737.1 hypothetical protein N7539_006183 [Penicillium diatomitis]
MGNKSSAISGLAHQPKQGDYALVLDAEKKLHTFPGPKDGDQESPEKALSLEVVKWREPFPVLVLTVSSSSLKRDFKEDMDDTADALQYTFKLPANYPGGRAALLNTIRELIDGSNPHGITETYTGKKMTNKFLFDKRANRLGEKNFKWQDTKVQYGCHVDWAQYSSKIFFRLRAKSREMGIIVVDRHADGYKFVVGQERGLIQQIRFAQFMALPARIWLHVQYQRRKAEWLDSQASKAQASNCGDVDMPVSKEADRPVAEERNCLTQEEEQYASQPTLQSQMSTADMGLVADDKDQVDTPDNTDRTPEGHLREVKPAAVAEVLESSSAKKVPEKSTPQGELQQRAVKEIVKFLNPLAAPWTAPQHMLAPESVATVARRGCSQDVSNQQSHQAKETASPSPRATGSSLADQSRIPEVRGFFWDMTYHSFLCQKEGCETRGSLWDGQSVICPFCGPYSYVRYCGREHMREDVRAHWPNCGQLTMKEPCVALSMPPDLLREPPAIPCMHGRDRPERHRQALWFSTARGEGDYFIFADGGPGVDVEWEPAALRGRCSLRVTHVVRFDDPGEKDRFRRVLAVCLLESLEVQPLVGYLFRMLRDRLRSEQQWSPELDVKIRRQLTWEFAICPDARDIGQRHACEAEWLGLPPRTCRDRTCEAERPSLLGRPNWSRWFERIVSNEEASHWILRANRTTHPVVKGVQARVRGEGFDHVPVEERRLFRRGEGWDGLGSGPWEWEGDCELMSTPM